MAVAISLLKSSPTALEEVAGGAAGWDPRWGSGAALPGPLPVPEPESSVSVETRWCVLRSQQRREGGLVGSSFSKCRVAGLPE